MKGINISSCASQASTAIYSSMEQYPPSSSSSSSSVLQSSTGSRAIDRHNPIITDSKRVTTTLGTPYCKSQTVPIINPKLLNNNNHKNIQHKGSNGMKKKNKKSRKLVDSGRKKMNGNKDGGGNNYQVKKSINVSKPSDLILMKVGCSVKPGDYISPAESSRYLLNNDNDNDFLDVLSDFDHGLKLVPYESKKDDVHHEIKKVDNDSVVAVEKADNSKVLKPTTSSSTSSHESSHHEQVVVLRVSLHCKGCERKMRKHISRMEGVTSFNIDFAAKKVTVVGDVTPLNVLASISKVMKNVQLWTTPPQPTAMSTTFKPASITCPSSNIKDADY